MADNSLNISVPLKLEKKTPPWGMIDYDPKTLSSDQQREFNAVKVNVRKENIIYLEKHPEIKALVSLIIRRAITQSPRDVVEFIAKFFARPEQDIEKEVLEIINESEVEYNQVPFANVENWDY